MCVCVCVSYMHTCHYDIVLLLIALAEMEKDRVCVVCIEGIIISGASHLLKDTFGFSHFES